MSRHAHPSRTDGTAPIPVIFIMSPGHSGSTLLDLLIGAHSEVISGGEFRTRTPARTMGCSCDAGRFERCPLWGTVARHLAADGYTLDTMEYYETEAPESFADFNGRLLRAMLTVSGATMVLDSSKRPGRLRLYRRHPELFDVRLVLLSRHPLGTLYAHYKRGASLHATALPLAGAYALHARYAWSARAIVQYERLADAVEETLPGIMAALGLAFEPAQTQLEHRANRHNLGGNPVRRKSITTIAADTAWRTALSRRQKAVATLAAAPAFLLLALRDAITWTRPFTRGRRGRT